MSDVYYTLPLSAPNMVTTGMPPAVRGKGMKITVPLLGGTLVTVDANFPITPQNWDLFLTILNAMKPGLVKSDSSSGAAGDESQPSEQTE